MKHNQIANYQELLSQLQGVCRALDSQSDSKEYKTAFQLLKNLNELQFNAGEEIHSKKYATQIQDMKNEWDSFFLVSFLELCNRNIDYLPAIFNKTGEARFETVEDFGKYKAIYEDKLDNYLIVIKDIFNMPNTTNKLRLLDLVLPILSKLDLKESVDRIHDSKEHENILKALIAPENFNKEEFSKFFQIVCRLNNITDNSKLKQDLLYRLAAEAKRKESIEALNTLIDLGLNPNAKGLNLGTANLEIINKRLKTSLLEIISRNDREAFGNLMSQTADTILNIFDKDIYEHLISKNATEVLDEIYIKCTAIKNEAVLKNLLSTMIAGQNFNAEQFKKCFAALSKMINPNQLQDLHYNIAQQTINMSNIEAFQTSIELGLDVNCVYQGQKLVIPERYNKGELVILQSDLAIQKIIEQIRTQAQTPPATEAESITAWNNLGAASKAEYGAIWLIHSVQFQRLNLFNSISENKFTLSADDKAKLGTAVNASDYKTQYFQLCIKNGYLTAEDLLDAAIRNDDVALFQTLQNLPEDALHRIIKGEASQILATLFTKDLDTGLYTQIDKDGNTPLHYAVLTGDVDLVFKLLKLNEESRSKIFAASELTIQNNEGKTPIAIALEQKGGTKQMILNLTNAMSPSDLAKDKLDAKDNTFLHLLAQSGNTEWINKAISEHGSVIALNKDGDTPLHVAIKHGHYNFAMKVIQRENMTAAEAQGKSTFKDLFFNALKGLLFRMGSFIFTDLLPFTLKENALDIEGKDKQLPLHTAIAVALDTKQDSKVRISAIKIAVKIYSGTSKTATSDSTDRAIDANTLFSIQLDDIEVKNAWFGLAKNSLSRRYHKYFAIHSIYALTSTALFTGMLLMSSDATMIYAGYGIAAVFGIITACVGRAVIDRADRRAPDIEDILGGALKGAAYYGLAQLFTPVMTNIVATELAVTAVYMPMVSGAVTAATLILISIPLTAIFTALENEMRVQRALHPLFDSSNDKGA